MGFWKKLLGGSQHPEKTQRAEKTTKMIAGAFWNNDKPGGLGIVFDSDDMQLDVLHAFYDVKWNEETDKIVLVAKLLGQLKTWAASRNADARAVYGTIYLLEKHGYIKSDEFNGTTAKSNLIG